MLQRLFTIRTARPFIGGLLPAFSLGPPIALILVLSLGMGPGCAAPEREIVHGIPISSGSAGEGDGAVGSVDPASTLIVQAVGPGGEAVAGASVVALHAAALDQAALVLSSRVTGDRIRTLTRRATWRGQTGGSGEVAVPVPGGGCLVAVEAGPLYGEAEYRGRGGDTVRVTLRARRAVEVSVRGSDGAPAEGVALTVRAAGAKGVLQALPITAVTDASGKAELFVPKGTTQGLEVLARLAMEDPPRVSIEIGTPAPIELPPMGSIEIEVAGHPTFDSAAAGLVQVFAASDGSRSRTTLAVPIVNGRAVIPRVQAGIPLRAICAVADGANPSEILASQSVPVAPVAMGETAQVRVSFSQYRRVGRKLERP